MPVTDVSRGFSLPAKKLVLQHMQFPDVGGANGPPGQHILSIVGTGDVSADRTARVLVAAREL
jgi:hypothetical protein